jgi:hypothetical protein
MTMHWYEVASVGSFILSSLALFYATRHCTSDLTIALVKEGSELSNLMEKLLPGPEDLKARWKAAFTDRGMAESTLARSKLQAADRLHNEAETIQRDLRSVLTTRLKPETALFRLSGLRHRVGELVEALAAEEAAVKRFD